MIAVVAPTCAGNGLGRAMCLYWIAASLSSVIFVAFDDGPIWKGAGDLSKDIIRVGNQKAFRDAIVQATAARDAHVTVWHSKPIGHTLSWSRRLAKEHLCNLVIDIDDDDAGFGDIFRAERFRNRLQLNFARSISPQRIRRRLASLRSGQTFTASSRALAQYLDLPQHTAVVPHVRPSNPRLASPTNLFFPRFGFFGTPRTFKGLEELRAFANAAGDRAELHLFRDPATVRQFAGVQNMVWHEPVSLTHLQSVYEHIDILMLPQRQQVAARFQLPAKLCDALQFRRVVLATPTPPIIEVAEDAFEPVDDWGDPQAIWRAVQCATERHADHTERVDRAFESITIERVAALTAGVLTPWRR